MPSTLLIGPPNDLVQNTVYALPARLVFITAADAIEMAKGTEGSAFAALTGANTTGVYVSGGFVRCTGGATVVRCKA